MGVTLQKKPFSEVELQKNLDTNLYSLLKKSPVLHHYLNNLKKQGLYSKLLPTDDGYFTAEVDSYGQKKYLHSITAPWEEAETLLQTIPPLSKKGCVHYFGVGLGYHLVLFLKKYPNVKKVFVYEEVPDWLFLALSVQNFSEELENGHLGICFEPNKKQQRSLFRGKDDYIWINPSFAESCQNFLKNRLDRFVEAEANGSGTALIVNIGNSPPALNLSSGVSREFESSGWKVFQCEPDTRAIEAGYFQYLPEILFSASFSSRLSKLANSLKVPYACWEVEKITNVEMFQPRSISPYTYIFTPFYEDVMKFQYAGAQAFYLPPVPTFPLSRPFHPPEYGQRYTSDISYIGTLFDDREMGLARLVEKIRGLMASGDETVQKEGVNLIKALKNALQRQNKFTKKNMYKLPDFLVDELNKMPPTQFFSFNPHLLHSILSKEAAFLQTITYLKNLAPREVSVYGNESLRTVSETNFVYKGHGDFHRDFEDIVRSSKINIGLTGIDRLDGCNDKPFNVLQCGGFFITNRSHLLEESFKNGKELVLFTSPEDLKKKCEYYLRESREREEIAENGMLRVQRDHTTAKRLKRILELVPTRRSETFCG